MRLSLSKALLLSVPAILLYFVPAAIPVLFLRAAFLHEAGRRHSDSALGSFVNEIGYEICFVAALFLTNQTNQGFADVSAFSRFWSAYWPDPTSIGFALFAFAALAMEPVAAVSFFVGALVSYRTAPGLYPKRAVPKQEILL
jgi:hypothetical protein